MFQTLPRVVSLPGFLKLQVGSSHRKLNSETQGSSVFFSMEGQCYWHRRILWCTQNTLISWLAYRHIICRKNSVHWFIPGLNNQSWKPRARVRNGISFRKNRLGTVSVILRKKELIPRHSEVHGKVNSEAQNGKELHEKKFALQNS